MNTPNSKNSRMDRYSTSQICKEAGVTRGQLRLYEREGLIENPSRSASGYRHYKTDTITRLKAIQGLKDVGLTLNEISGLLSERDFSGLSRPQLQLKAHEILQKTEIRIGRLEVIRDYLGKFVAGDFSVLDEPECSFLTDFLTATPIKSKS